MQCSVSAVFLSRFSNSFKLLTQRLQAWIKIVDRQGIYMRPCYLTYQNVMRYHRTLYIYRNCIDRPQKRADAGCATRNRATLSWETERKVESASRPSLLLIHPEWSPLFLLNILEGIFQHPIRRIVLQSAQNPMLSDLALWCS